MKTALIGHGYWGEKLYGYLRKNKFFDLKYICDSKTNLDEILPKVKAVVVATPISTHYQVVKKALEHNCHVFCEKPLTKKTKECLELKELAEKKNKVLCVDFTWTFSPTIRRLEHILINELKITLKRVRRDGVKENVEWILFPHVLSIAMMLKPLTISYDYGYGKRQTELEVNNRTVLLDHEKNNLEYAVEYFADVIKGEQETNIDIAIKITQMIENNE